MTELCANALSDSIRQLLPVATIADLRLLDAPDDTKFIQVLGYYSAGDGGGGTFYWDSASTATDDSATIGSIIQPTAGGTGRWILISGNGVAALTTGGTSGSALVEFTPSGSGAVARTVQAKLRDLPASPGDFNATADAVADDSTELQAAIDALNAAGGGILECPRARYNLGTTGLTLYSNITIRGAGNPYVNSTRGTEFLYSGTGTAIGGSSLLNVVLEDFSIDASNATGAAQRGVGLLGVWLTTVRNVRVKGIAPADGYGILVTTGSSWGAQHNYFERVECPDGVIRLAGTNSSDQVTTTVFNTIRGAAYEVVDASITFINATAEKNGTMTVGFAFSNTGDSTMIACDIEAAYTTGITQANTHSVTLINPIWSGFSGTTRLSGTFCDWTNHNANLILKNIGQGVAAMPYLNWQDNNAHFVRLIPTANNVTGGAQDGHLVVQRNNSGAGLTNQLELRRVLRLEHSLSIANSATTVLTIPIPTNKGIRVRAHAEGIQTGAGTFSCMRDSVAINNSGTVTQTSGTEMEIAAGGAAPAFTFTPSSTNLLVQFNHASATPTTINFVIEIDGPVASYTKA